MLGFGTSLGSVGRSLEATTFCLLLDDCVEIELVCD